MRRVVLCATTNDHKFGIGKAVLGGYDILLEKHPLDLIEIQSEDPEIIIRDKAQKAYAQLGQPVIVSDDSWSIPALRGFPGSYMKSISHWLEPEDFLALMAHKTDRRIFLNQCVAYCDGTQTVVFGSDIPGVIAEESHGTSGTPIMKITELDGDNGKTISETYDNLPSDATSPLADYGHAWEKLGQWLKEHA